jgi:rare lipoprotein A
MLVQSAKRILFFFIALLALMIWASPSVGQIIDSEGYASWYNRGDHGDQTASGEFYDHNAMTAAHPYLPFDTMVRVTRLDTGRSVVVRINDRMASGPGHIIDLSGAAAAKLGLQDANVARVRLDIEQPSDLLQVRDRFAFRYEPTGDENALAARSEPVERERVQVQANSVRVASTDDRLASAELPVADSPSDYRYTLQVGVFSTRPAAAAFAGKVSNGWIREVKDSGSTMYRVYFDRFSQEQPARVAQKQLKAQGFDSFLREIL